MMTSIESLKVKTNSEKDLGFTDLHQFPHHVSPHHVVKYRLQSGVFHQTELHSVSAELDGWMGRILRATKYQPVPHEDGGGLLGGDCHLEVLVGADSEPLGRVEKLVISDQVQGTASLGDDQPDNSCNC